MSGSTIKRKIKRFEKKLIRKHQELVENQKETEAKNIELLLKKRQEKYLELKTLKTKIKFAKKKAKELNRLFILEKQKYLTKSEFKKEFALVKQKRHEYIKELKNEYKIARLNYNYEFETTSYLLKRWVYGMGKEFLRISWLKKKTLLTHFLIVVIIVILLALIFLGIDSIFIQ